MRVQLNRNCLIALFIPIIAIAIYSGINNGSTAHYDDGEISFDYPHTWQFRQGLNPSEVALFEPISDLKVTVNKQVIPPGYQHPENFILNTSEAYNYGFKLLSHQVTTLNGNIAYENSYYINSNGKIYLQKELWIPKNGNLYSITYTYHLESLKLPAEKLEEEIIVSFPDKDNYNSPKQIDENYFDFKSAMERSKTIQGFKIMEDSFKVNSVLIPAKTPYWAEVSIPSINVSWGVRSDTVNGYNSVYHYNESFYPAQNGTMGLLGHRSLFSAPFARIDQLEPGDKVIINDYLTLKKYIYKVISNGDINWNYLNDPVKFPAGSNNLKLVTCHPPGTTEAAWIVHCKLISIEPL